QELKRRVLDRFQTRPFQQSASLAMTAPVRPHIVSRRADTQDCNQVLWILPRARAMTDFYFGSQVNRTRKFPPCPHVTRARRRLTRDFAFVLSCGWTPSRVARG